MRRHNTFIEFDSLRTCSMCCVVGATLRKQLEYISRIWNTCSTCENLRLTLSQDIRGHGYPDDLGYAVQGSQITTDSQPTSRSPASERKEGNKRSNDTNGGENVAMVFGSTIIRGLSQAARG